MMSLLVKTQKLGPVNSRCAFLAVLLSSEATTAAAGGFFMISRGTFGPERTQMLAAKRGLISSAITWDMRLLLPISSPFAALTMMVDLVRCPATCDMFCLIEAEG